MRLAKARLVPLTAVPDSKENIAQMPQEVHLQGLRFPERPVALADRSIVFVDLLTGTSGGTPAGGPPNACAKGRTERSLASNGGVARASFA
jgi:hypothetical protein